MHLLFPRLVRGTGAVDFPETLHIHRCAGYFVGKGNGWAQYHYAQRKPQRYRNRPGVHEGRPYDANGDSFEYRPGSSHAPVSGADAM